MAVNFKQVIIDFVLNFILLINSIEGFIRKLILHFHFDRYFHQSSFLVMMLMLQDLKYLNECY